MQHISMCYVTDWRYYTFCTKILVGACSHVFSNRIATIKAICMLVCIYKIRIATVRMCLLVFIYSLRIATVRVCACWYIYIHGLSRNFRNFQNSPTLRRPNGARPVLLFSNEFDELRRENCIALSCLVIVLCFLMWSCLARLAIL